MKMRFILAFASALVIAGSPAIAAASKSLPPALVGGAKPGMKYADVRLRLLRAGFKPVPRAKDEFCGYNDQCSLPETEACAGAGDGNCSYRFIKGRQKVQVMGRYGMEGKPLSQDVYLIEHVK